MQERSLVSNNDSVCDLPRLKSSKMQIREKDMAMCLLGVIHELLVTQNPSNLMGKELMLKVSRSQALT